MLLIKELIKELSDCLIEVENNKKIRCVILTGDNKSFSSGADMKEAPESDMPFWAEKKRLLSWKNIENFKKTYNSCCQWMGLRGWFRISFIM